MQLPADATQFEGTDGSEERDIVIGLDFGTSCTKVVLQEPLLRNAYAVPFFETGHLANAYLMASRLGYTKKGKCRLVGFDSKGGGGLKLALMKSPEKVVNLKAIDNFETNALELCSCFIALVLQHIRIWFLENFQEDYGQLKIRWHLNLGIPTRNYDEDKIKEAFLVAAKAGWRLSICQNFTVYDAKDVVNQALDGNFDPGIHVDFINVVPEVAAEVAGYVRSPLRKLGLHMIVDVGSNTMDTATFRLQQSEEGYEYCFLWADVCEYACKGLHTCRVQSVKENLSKWIKELRNVEDIRGEIPADHSEYSPPETDLSETDLDFLAQARRPVSKVVAISYRHRDPNAHEWRQGVPLFLCGGGSNLSLFKRDLIMHVQKDLTNYNIEPFNTRPLPKPDNLSADHLEPSHYHRLAVAYGLSFFYDDIGKLVPPSEIDDLEKMERIREPDSQYIDHDMV